MRHPALAQQHHLDALTLLGGYFPSQRCFQPPDLALGAFDHLFPSESDDLSESHLASRRQFTATFGTRYPKHFDSISYGSGISHLSLLTLLGSLIVGQVSLSGCGRLLVGRSQKGMQ